MAENEIPSSQQIPFSHEILRKATHMGALIIPGGYYLLGLSRLEMLQIMIPVTLLMILIDISRLRQWKFWRNFAGPLTSRMIRAHEHAGDFTGATYILIAVCVTVAMYQKPIAIAALAFIIVGDSAAALFGRRFGKHKLFTNKSIEGSLACLAGTVIVAVVVPDLQIAVGLVGAFVAAFVEAAPLGIDDNITVPVLSGLVMTLIVRLVENGIF